MKPNLELARKLIDDKLKKAIEKHGGRPFSSSHEILGALTEEYHEFIQEVHDNNSKKAADELADIAICCLWGIDSIYKQYTCKENKNGK